MIDTTAANGQTRIESTLRSVLPNGTLSTPVRVTLDRRTWLTSNRSEVVAVLARGGRVDL